MINLNGEQNCEVIQQLASWIDTQVIALAINDYLNYHGQEVSFENGKAVWLEMLERLGLSVCTTAETNR